MTIKQSAAIAVLFASIGLTGAGCFSQQPMPDGLSIYEDTAVGISFTYPEAWGPITTDVEMGWKPDETKGIDPGEPTNCVHQRLYVASEVHPSAVFLVSGRADASCDILGRGGYFGDRVNTVFEYWEHVESWCYTHDSCELFTTAHGIQIAHAYTKEKNEWGDLLTDVDEYAFLDENRNAYIVSNERLVLYGLGRQKDALRALVDSLSFTD